MQKTKQTSTKLLVITITTAAIITAATTTQILQPAYSQASHCADLIKVSVCTTPGQDPSSTTCSGSIGSLTCAPSIPIGGDNPHQEAGQLIGECHSQRECTVIHLDR